jgi:hypothetical protein
MNSRVSERIRKAAVLEAGRQNLPVGPLIRFFKKKFKGLSAEDKKEFLRK